MQQENKCFPRSTNNNRPVSWLRFACEMALEHFHPERNLIIMQIDDIAQPTDSHAPLQSVPNNICHVRMRFA